jgi:hypothetical protein
MSECFTLNSCHRRKEPPVKKKRRKNRAREDPVERAMELDRQYFAVHPGVNAYLRLLVPGEFRHATPASHTVLVEQLRPGVRVRVEVADGRSLEEALFSRPLLTDRQGNPIPGLGDLQPLWSRGLFQTDPQKN